MPDTPVTDPPCVVPRGLGWAIKRLIDIAASFLGLLVLSPLLLILILTIALDSGWPPFFKQERVGRCGRRFKLVKFRTMVLNAEKLGAGLYFEQNDPRVTRVGKFLRRFSLDELPQLWNVLKGDESLIGPRAMVPAIAYKLNPEQNRRHRVRPGVSGWAQVNGRNSLTWSKRVELDNWYIDHWSLWLDVKILLLTVKVVLFSEGVLMDQSAADVDDL
jgi:lipopolysaccharide/colanic/teichoic acid biosynthesis glycosyltransferase